MNPRQTQSGGPSGFDGTSSAPVAPAAAGLDIAPPLAPGFVAGVDRGGCNEMNVHGRRPGLRCPHRLRLPSRLSRATAPPASTPHPPASSRPDHHSRHGPPTYLPLKRV